MMHKQRMSIISYQIDTARFLESLVEKLFGPYIETKIYCLEDGSLETGIYADLIIISSQTVFEEVKKHVMNDAEIIIPNYTLTKAGLDLLKKLPAGTKAMLVNKNIKVCMETITLIYQLGCRELNLIPVYPGLTDLPDVSLAITPAEVKSVPPHVKDVLDIGERVLDMNTIADIAAKLNLQNVLNSGNVTDYFERIMPISYGLEKTLHENIYLSSQQNLLLDILEQGIIIINSAGLIFSYNMRAEKILDIPQNEAIGQNYVKIIPQIQFDQVLESFSPIKNKLIFVNDTYVEESIYPIMHANSPYGAIAIINRFTEIEKKQHKLRAQLLNKGLLAKYTFEDILGQSAAIKRCKDMAGRMAASDSAILITSESGTGKELFAQGIHNASKRREYQFVAVNCAALSESLLESELFGYEGGAFTGAKKEGKMGLFELAHNGTLFLDEIGDMPLLLQARLLRTLQEKTVMRIGGESVINVNVRIICATNRDLKKLVNQGLFRKDLYFRISVLPLSIPPLRERTEDIPILTQEFMKGYHANFLLEEGAKCAMEQYDWPGNVRELRNYVEYFSNIGKKVIEASDLPFFNEDPLNQVPEWNAGGEYKEDPAVQAFRQHVEDLDSHLVVLKILDESYRCHRRVGRRSLSQMASEMGLYLSEQEIRSILLKLESYCFVEIKKGRAGTKITEAGRSALRQVSSRERGHEA